jgi:hypothetical protein
MLLLIGSKRAMCLMHLMIAFLVGFGLCDVFDEFDVCDVFGAFDDVFMITFDVLRCV